MHKQTGTCTWIAGLLLLAAPPSFGGEQPPRFDPSYPWSARPADTAPLMPDFESPQSTLRRLERAHVELDLAAYASVLSADYRFLTEDPRINGRYPEGGFDRATDIETTAGLFGVVPGALPKPRSIDLDFGLVSEGPDPEHADSLEHYRLLMAPHPTMEIAISTGDTLHLARSLQAFHMVRGDAAVLPPGAPADAGHWYVRRWVETPEPGWEADGATGAPAKAHLTLARNPTAEAFEIHLALPESGLYGIEVFDVLGRRLLKQPPARFGAGEHTLSVDGTRALPAGIYWVSLVQDGRALHTVPATRL